MDIFIMHVIDVERNESELLPDVPGPSEHRQVDGSNLLDFNMLKGLENTKADLRLFKCS